MLEEIAKWGRRLGESEGEMIEMKDKEKSTKRK
jgi:hypothetical protein